MLARKKLIIVKLFSTYINLVLPWTIGLPTGMNPLAAGKL